MFGLSFGEIVIIAVLALLLLGADRLPDAARTLGKGLREFRRATEDLKDQIQGEIYADERPKPPAVPPVASRSPGPPPEATAENVPGLEAALAESSPAEAGEPASRVGEPATETAAEPGPSGTGPTPEGEAGSQPPETAEPDEPAGPERLA